MSKLTLLKRILDVAYLSLLLFGVGIAYLFLPEILMKPAAPAMKVFFSCMLIAGLLYVYSVYLLRETIRYFKDRDVFNSTVIKNLNTIGKCLIVSPVISGATIFVFYMVYGSDFGVKYNISYGSWWFSIFQGLFFMVLSEVFRMAKEMKDENELTV